MLVNKSKIKIPGGKGFPMVDNVSNVNKIHFSNHLASFIESPFVGVFRLGARMFGFTYSIVKVGVGIDIVAQSICARVCVNDRLSMPIIFVVFVFVDYFVNTMDRRVTKRVCKGEYAAI